MKQTRKTDIVSGIRFRGLGLPAARVLLAAALSLTGCSKESAEAPVGTGEEIVAAVAVPDGFEADAATKSAVNGNAQLTLYFRRSDERSAGDWDSYGSTVLNAGYSAGTMLSFSPKQFYLTSGLKTRMVGWYPFGRPSTNDNDAVNWTIDGTQDILLAPAQEGSKTAPISTITFSHALTQLRFLCHAEDQTAVDQWGKITAIRVLGQRTGCIFRLTAGTFAFTGSSRALSVTGVAAKTPPVGGASVASQFGQELMIEPQTAASYQLILEIETEKQGAQQIAVPARAYEKGKAAEIILYFKRLGVEVTLIPQPWVTHDVTIDNVGKQETTSYPHSMNGSVIVVRNSFGRADPKVYPTHSPWATTPLHQAETYQDNLSTYNTLGEIYQVAASDAVDKDGLPTLNWYQAVGVEHVAYNPTGYSACAQYSEASDQRDKGLWRCPTIQEVHVIFTQRNNLTAIDPLSANRYWSATDRRHVNYADRAWSVLFQLDNGQVDSQVSKSSKSSMSLRCVRDLKAVPVSQDYPKVQNGNTIVVQDFAGKADTVSYPVHGTWTTTPFHREPDSWETNLSGGNTVGKKFRVASSCATRADGLVAMTWYEAAGVRQTAYNPTGYSACAQYSEASGQSDKGLWRLPTVRELKLIHDKRSELTAVEFPNQVNLWVATRNKWTVWGVLFFVEAGTDGTANQLNEMSSHQVLCVRDV